MFESTNKQESAAPAVSQQIERPAHWFKPGQSGNPKGREKGSKNKITQAYLDSFAADYLEHGPAVIEWVRENEPGVYLKLAAALVPKDLDVQHSGDVNIRIVKYADDQADLTELAQSGQSQPRLLQ